MRIRNVSFVLCGVAALVFKRLYSGPLEVLVRSYAGNVAVSFAVYFMALHVPIESRHKRLLAAALAIGAVELFELFDGFGIMSNVYDPVDLLANVVGVSLALAIDSALAFRHRAATNV